MNCFGKKSTLPSFDEDGKRSTRRVTRLRADSRSAA